MVGVLDVRKRHCWWQLTEGLQAPESNALTSEGIYDGHLTKMWENAILNSLGILYATKDSQISPLPCTDGGDRITFIDRRDRLSGE